MLARLLIERKRDGGRIEPGEWRALITAYTAGDVPDHQMAALLMAIYMRGLDADETAALTTAMLCSGAMLGHAALGRPRVDKHSTGGVGDKVSLVLAPLMAAAGVAVPMIFGRGLGHTGGTADKLEAIPGFRTELPLAQARAQLEQIGCVMMTQSAEIAPADRRIYALRDATATIESLPLIAASIMSKKLAEGLTGLVLDVKHGSGALIPDVARGLELAECMIGLGKANGLPVVALMTAMDQPLGRACGNALETEEAILALTGNGPPDLIALTVALGTEMLLVARVVATAAEGRARLEEALASGAAARKFQDVIGAQGGNPAVVDDPAVLPQAAECELFAAPRSGVVVRIEPREIGRAIIALGGGRTNADDIIDPTVGFVIGAKAGDWVDGGEPLATIFARDRAGVKEGRAVLRRAIVVGDESLPPLPLITHRVTERGIERYKSD
jgi:pyrimidine-nucleoside phosphorylase